MTIINQKSISGITSITTAAAGDNLLTFHTNDGTERFRIDNSGSTKITAGIVTTLTVTGNGTIGGTLGVTNGNISLDDSTSGSNGRLNVGTGDDLQIYHYDNANYIDNQSSTPLYIRVNGSETAIVAAANDSVDLYYDNSKKFETKSDGVSVTGEIAATGAIDAEGRADIGSTSLDDYAVAGFTNSASYGGIYAQNNNANGNLFTGQENSTEVFKVLANGRINSGNPYTSGDGVNIFAGGSIYIRQDGSTGGVLRIRNGSDYKIDLKGNGDADFAGAVKIGGTAAANQIDEYEEGTFTPVWQTTGTAYSSVSYSTQVGNYTKIGNLCHVSIRLRSTASSGGSGALLIGGLPYNVNDTTGAGGGAPAMYYINVSSGTVVVTCETRDNTNQFYLLASSDAGAWANVQYDGIVGSGISELRISFAYQTD